MAGNTGGRAIGSAGSALSVPAMTKAGERLSENENSAVLAWGLCLQDLKCVTGRVCFVLGLLQGTGYSPQGALLSFNVPCSSPSNSDGAVNASGKGQHVMLSGHPWYFLTMENKQKN